MTTPNLEPLDDDILALLGEVKPVPELDAAAKAKILGTVASRLPPPGGGGGTGGSSPMSSSGLVARGAKMLAIFGVGIATGVGIAPAVRSTPPAPVVVRAAPPAAVPTASSTPESTPEPTLVLELPNAPPRVAAAPRPSEAPSSRGLAAERALLDVARAAIARGDATEALASVDRHAHEYPDGVLVEEREALAIKALVAVGRRDDAERRAQRFEERFPNGLMLRAVKSALGAP
jgi:hypothetical protein